MAAIELLHIYGPYYSNVTGNAVFVDLLKPPKKCPLDCITCPLGSTRVSESEIAQGANIDRVISELDEAINAFKKNSLSLNTIYIWGSGDPMVLSNIDEALATLGNYIRSHTSNTNTFLHTSMVSVGKLVKRSRNVEEYIDKVFVPYLWYGEDKTALGWSLGHNLNMSLEVLRNANTILKGKIVVEVHVFRIGNTLYPDPQHLAEVVAHLKSTRSEEVVVKNVERPSNRWAVKPAPPSYLEKVKEELLSAGFRVIIEELKAPPKKVLWRNTITSLYNYLLRMPLKYTEILGLYGDLGIEALNNLVSRNLAIKIPWSGSIFYKCVL
jgi:wyosine [tRNA(Phe)-imidazoG37] synthetase (radical SAM superfamily)